MGTLLLVSEEFVRLGVFESRVAALEVARRLRAYGIGELNVWAVATPRWWRSPVLGPHEVVVAKRRLTEARKALREAALGKPA